MPLGHNSTFLLLTSIPMYSQEFCQMPTSLSRLLHKLPQVWVGQAAAFSTLRACRSSRSRLSFLFMERTNFPAGRIMRPVHRMKVRRRVLIFRKRHGAVGFGVVPRTRGSNWICSSRVMLWARMSANMYNWLPTKVPTGT